MKYLFNSLGKNFLTEDFSKKGKYKKKLSKNKKVNKDSKPKSNNSNSVVENGNRYNVNKSYLRKLDSGGTWHVRFFKVDGTIRDMLCTRDWSKLKIDKYQGYVEPSYTSGRIIPTYQVIVWDTQAKGFRSFRANSVLLFEQVSKDIVTSYNDKIKYSRDELIDKLSKENLKIIFIKRDGTKRIMNCTRDIKDFKDEFEGYKNLIRVWDLDKKDYRTIVYSNILSVSPCTKVYKSN